MSIRIVSRIGALAGAAAITCAAGAGAADGYITLRGASADIRVSGLPDTDTTYYGVDGAVVFQPRGRYNIQLNLALDDYEDVDQQLLSGDAHLFWGETNAYTVGGFASYVSMDTPDIDVWGAGLEFDLYSDVWTGAFQAGYFDGDADTEVFAVAGQGRLFATPNFMVELSGAFGAVEVGGADLDSYGLGMEIEYQFPDTPVSIFLGGRQVEVHEQSSSFGTVLAGARFNFRTRSLYERDRRGASMRGSQEIVDYFWR